MGTMRTSLKRVTKKRTILKLRGLFYPPEDRFELACSHLLEMQVADNIVHHPRLGYPF